jgi:hypothetical protein
VRRIFERLWTPVGAGVKSQEEVDALALYLFGDSVEGREAIREIDRNVQEMPGLEGLTLLEDVLDRAIERAQNRPGYAGTRPAPQVDDSLRGAPSEAWGLPREPVTP